MSAPAIVLVERALRDLGGTAPLDAIAQAANVTLREAGRLMRRIGAHQSSPRRHMRGGPPRSAIYTLTATGIPHGTTRESAPPSSQTDDHAPNRSVA